MMQVINASGLEQIDRRDKWRVLRKKLNIGIAQSDTLLADMIQAQQDIDTLEIDLANAIITGGGGGGGDPADYAVISSLANNAVPVSGSSISITTTDGSLDLINSTGISSGVLGLYFKETQVQGQLEVQQDPVNQIYGVGNLRYLDNRFVKNIGTGSDIYIGGAAEVVTIASETDSLYIGAGVSGFSGELEIGAVSGAANGVPNIGYLTANYYSKISDDFLRSLKLDKSSASPTITATDGQLTLDDSDIAGSDLNINFEQINVFGGIVLTDIAPGPGAVLNAVTIANTYYSRALVDAGFVSLTAYNAKVIQLENRLDALEAIINSGALEVDSITFNLGGWTQQGVSGGGIEQIAP